MKISARHRDGVTIIDVRGKITIGVGDVALRDAVREAVGASSGNILINMAEVSTVDSSGIGELVSAYTTVTNQGRKLALEFLPAKVSDLLQITQLVAVFDIFEDEDEAVGALQ